MSAMKVEQAAWMQKEAEYIAKTFNRQPVVWDRGEGFHLFDLTGRKYLDFFSGHAVMNLGYNHPAQMQAMTEQMKKLVHTGNLYYLQTQIALAELLVNNTFGDKVFFTNTGAEITELAIKLARKWARANRPADNQYEILTLKNSFHGRTMGALSATGQEKYQQGLEPMLPGFKHIAVNNFTAAAAAITNRTCAIMLEPIMGEGGIRLCTEKYLKELRGLCDRNHLLLIFDEIQCGLGRTGYFNAYEYFAVVPDVLLLAKPLGGGLPISALVTRAEIASTMKLGDHGSTFGGNPVAAAGGIVLLNEMVKPGFLAGVRKVGDYLGQQLQTLVEQFPDQVAEARGRGMMWGLELKKPGAELVNAALHEGVNINCTAGNVLRFLPALTIQEAEVDEVMAVLVRLLKR